MQPRNRRSITRRAFVQHGALLALGFAGLRAFIETRVLITNNETVFVSFPLPDFNSRLQHGDSAQTTEIDGLCFLVRVGEGLG